MKTQAKRGERASVEEDQQDSKRTNMADAELQLTNANNKSVWRQREWNLARH